MKEYVLPEWAFLDAHSHLGDTLEGRTVILHLRSASVIEIIDRENDGFKPAEGVLGYNFKYTSPAGVEKLSAILHYSATIDKVNKELIRSEILKPCAIWYCDYCAWEDHNILNTIFTEDLPAYETYKISNFLMIQRNKYPRFTAEVIFGDNIFSLNDIKFLDEKIPERDVDNAIKKANEFLKKRFKHGKE